MTRGTRETVERWVAAFNENVVSAIAQLYAQDAINHQIALAPVVGSAGVG